ncbi:MAG: response regulator [Gemmobacter sp.]|uniref:response regulator n=1 Tax=Gemmobacter sp. TaxID=1898957 RepID=UPI00391A8CE7
MPQPDSLRASPPPLFGPALPLQGLTLLAVEDSRFACEALRLMAQRSGARLRRAETLHDARRHLALYRPDLVLVDLGLPDGPGTALIRDLAVAAPGGPVVLGMSGDPGMRGAALAAGAAGFVDKPIGALADFQGLVLRHLPGRDPARAEADAPAPEPDRLALREDLARAAGLLAQDPDAAQRAYLARFLAGIARSTRDSALARAAADLPQADEARLAHLVGLVALRIGETPRPFA